jgi:hypothetical protein
MNHTNFFRISLGLIFITLNSKVDAQAVTFSYTGVVQTYTVQPCVYTLSVDVKGAEGGSSAAAAVSPGGRGGRVQAYISVTPGDVINIYVGQKPNSTTGGWNGGGSSSSLSGAGGGASDIRIGGTALSNRVVVAGGGGGGGYYTTSTIYIGGHGGGLTGTDGYTGVYGGNGGTQTMGGAPGTGTGGNGTSGALGLGGSGGTGDGGGGGGGYYGGGGGGFTGTIHGGGGGGSGYASSLTSNVVHTSAYQWGHGEVIINPLIGPATPASISGSSILCSGSTATFSIAAVPTAISYTWSVPPGATINSGQGTTSVSVTFGMTSGSMSVTATNACGTSAPAVLAITIIPTPAYTGLASDYCVDHAPVVLSGSPSGGFFSGPGMTDSTFDPMAAGAGTHTISYSMSGTEYTYTQTGTFSPLAGSGNPVSLSDDMVSGNLPIGFTFNFYGTNYTEFYISSNGFITFNPASGNGCCSGPMLPNNDMSLCNLVAFAWNDLNPGAGGTVEYFTTGTTPNRKLAVTFTNVPYFSGGSPLTSQVILYETSNIIEIHTTAVSGDGDLQTMGIENDGGTLATPVAGRNSVNWNANNDFVRFLPPTTCSYLQTVTVNALPAAPAITPAGNISICNGDSVVLTSDVASSYLWSENSTTQAISVNTAGSYEVTITDSNGCNATSSPVIVTVNPSPSPTITAGGPTTFCSGGSVTLSCSAASSYLWTGMQTTNSIAVTASGNYTVTVTDANGCTGVSSPVTVTVNSPPVVSFSNLAGGYCLSNPPASLAGSPSGGTFSGPGITGNSFNPSAAGTGTHTIMYTFTDANGCSGSQSHSTTVTQNAFVDLGADTIICTTATLTLDPGNFSAYTWQDNSTTQTFTVNGNILGPGNYTFYVQVTDANGCAGTDTVHVNVSVCTGIAGLNAPQLTVSPNPSSGDVTLQLINSSGEVTITVVDMVGRIVLAKKSLILNGRLTETIDLSAEAKGVYYIIISNDDETITAKVILQ